MEQMSINEIEKDLYVSKLAVTGTYIMSFGYALVSVCEAFARAPGEAAAYAFCSAVAYAASAILGTRIDEMNNAMDEMRKGSLEEKVE